MSRKLFCEYGPVAYEISVRKEAILKDIDDYIIKRYKIAKKKNYENFEYLWKGEAKILFRKFPQNQSALSYYLKLGIISHL